MLKKLKIRTKIILMPVLALLAFGTIFAINTWFGSQNSSLLTQLNEGYYPALETSQELEEILASIQRDMQYAVSAADEEVLEQTNEMNVRFLDLVNKSYENLIIDKLLLDSIKTNFNEYYPLAKGTVVQMLEGSFNEEVVQNLAKLQSQYNLIQGMLSKTTNRYKLEMSDKIEEAQDNQESTVLFILLVTVFSIILIGLIALFFIKSITNPLQQMVKASLELAKGEVDIEIDAPYEDEIGDLAKSTAKLVTSTKDLASAADAIGQGDYQVPINIRSDRDILGNAIVRMKNNLQTMTMENELDDWYKTGQANLSNKMRGDQTVIQLSKNVVQYLAEYLGAQVGAVYLKIADDKLKLAGSYAFKKRKNLSNEHIFGEGLVGQAALEKESILITNVPDDYITINSGIGEAKPLAILVTPLVIDDQVVGVIELGTFHEFTEDQLKFIEQASENISIALQSAQARVKVKELLEETQSQAAELKAQQEELQVTNEELQAQQEELRVANEELEEQTENLKKSEETLKEQQSELQGSNEELEKQTEILTERQQEIENKNSALEFARNEIEEKAKELEITSKYKSEFLANMSHELRTPMNSIQILSKLLSENKDKNLTEKQLNFAKTINSSGEDLLNLINEILDLSKIEAGKMTINVEKMSLKILPSYVQQHFEHVTDEKKIYLKVNADKTLPESVYTDRQRIEQIFKNLMSNAIKFTTEGGITVGINRPNAELIKTSDQDLDPKTSIAISVTDTGIGIPEEKKNLIFQAFQQADGTTSRKFGGTGLGLSISRELAKLLKGDIFIESEDGKGSIFTLVIPEKIDGEQAKEEPEENGEVVEEIVSIPELKPVEKTISSAPVEKEHIEIRDDRLNLVEDDKTILVIEDDFNFSKVLFDYTREKGYKCLIADDGEAGLQLANQFLPSAIILDVGLPRIDGWTVMERLKNDPVTRHIPVYFISGHDKKITAMRMGAIGYLTKPVNLDALESAFSRIEHIVSKDVKKLLVVEDDQTMRDSILELIGGDDISITTTDTGKEALKLIKSNEFDSVIIDLGLSDISGFDLIEKINSNKKIDDIPIIVYTGKELTKKEESRLRKQTESIIIKGAKSPDRLLDEVSLFLHRVENNSNGTVKAPIPNGDMVFTGKKVLLVDDDIRNIYALSSVLEEKEMEIVVAENGVEAIEMLEKTEGIDLTLMDIMMPEMDGYEAMTKIREKKEFQKMPIIALTAKAMKGDRQKCIDAGANDYLSKPIDVEKLLSILHVWLYK